MTAINKYPPQINRFPAEIGVDELKHRLKMAVDNRKQIDQYVADITQEIVRRSKNG